MTRTTRRIRYHAATLTVAAIATLVLPHAVHAQRADAGFSTIVGAGIEIRPVVGAFIPTVDQRNLLTDAVLVGGELGWHFVPSFAVVGAFGWAPTRDQLTGLPGNPLFTGRQEKIDLFQYDLGLEWRLHYSIPAPWPARPYLGAGAGGRTYSFRHVSTSSQTNLLGYGKLGIDVAPADGLFGLRLEARDNLTRFKGLSGELVNAATRNDLQLTAGLTLRL